MTTYTGPQLLAWRTGAGLTQVQAAPVLIVSRQTYISLELNADMIPQAAADALSYYVAHGVIQPVSNTISDA